MPGPERPGCGPSVADQVENVRVAGLEYLIARALDDAAQLHHGLKPMALAEAVQLEPGGETALHDPPPGLVERFASRTPSVQAYSSVVGTDALVFTTGDLCWSSHERAVVRAGVFAGTDVQRTYDLVVERRNGKWSVTSVDGNDELKRRPA